MVVVMPTAASNKETCPMEEANAPDQPDDVAYSDFDIDMSEELLGPLGDEPDSEQEDDIHDD